MRLYKTDGVKNYVERDGEWALSRVGRAVVNLTGIWYTDDGWMYFTTDELDVSETRQTYLDMYDTWDEEPTVVITAQPMHDMVYGIA